jgi:hypothetical protein
VPRLRFRPGLLLLVLPLALALVGARGAAEDGTPARGLRAGAAAVALPAPIGSPLAGYNGAWDRIADSVLDPPEARALVFDDGATRIGIVALDILIVRPAVRAEIEDRTRDLQLDALLVAATHTHSGPGGYIEGWLGGRVTGGSFDERVPGRIAAAGADAVHAAARGLTPVRVGVGLGRLDLARNRRHEDGPRESVLPVLEIRAEDGGLVARAFSYGVHPVALGPASHAYSADLVGAARAALDAEGGVSLFLAGPLGDQNPVTPPHVGRPRDVAAQRENARAWGARMAEAVRATPVAGSAASGDETLVAAQRWFHVPAISLPRGSILWWFAPLARPHVDAFLSKRVPFQALRIGGACFLAFPAEPASALGDAARALVPSGCTPFVVAHANDWLGYAVSEADYATGGYEVGFSPFGPGFGAWLVARSNETLQALSSHSAVAGSVAR